MANITLDDVKAWTEPTKVGAVLSALDADLEKQVSSLILTRLMTRFTTTGWSTPTVTPQLVRTVIAMYYVSYVYDKTYSTDDNLAAYAVLLREQADLNIEGLLSGAISLPEEPTNGAGFGGPSFYPNDASSALPASVDDPSLGPAKFSMGEVW